MTSECEHDELIAVWGDDRAYYSKDNIVHNKDHTLKTTESGDWIPRDSGWGELDEGGSRWVISIECLTCGQNRVEDACNNSKNSDEDDELVKRIKEMGP